MLAWVGAEVLFLTRVGRGYLMAVADLCSLVPRGPSPKSWGTECMDIVNGAVYFPSFFFPPSSSSPPEAAPPPTSSLCSFL